jgi:lipid A ethanolaminephosphotransferase
MKAIQSSQIKLIIASNIYFSLIFNYAFWNNIFLIYPIDGNNILFLISLFLFFTSLNIVLMVLVSSRYTIKPLLIFLFVATSFIAYFVDSYGVVINTNMIQNTIETNSSEVADLITLKMFLYFIFLGGLPSLLIYTIKINYESFKKEILKKFLLLVGAITVMVINLFLFSQFYTSFFREHKPLRYYANPTYPLYSAGVYLKAQLATKRDFEKIGLDAKISSDKATNSKPKLVIFIVGEAARAENFSLNGYPKDTNPNLSKIDILNYSNVSSCGTETAISVPCMFSVYDRSNYTDAKGKSTENVLDVLNRAGINLLWRDNNSDSKSVADRITYEDLNHQNDEKLCQDGECFDEILLKDLQAFVDKSTKDTFIILHQKGSHGPAYYKRYPKEFEKFTPVCKSSQLENCTQEEIQNSYNNTILYTDFFIAQTIKFLESNSKKFQTAMLYSADHGESLGEKGIYLHGMPYLIAPKQQTHIAFLQWFSEDFKEKINQECLKRKSNNDFSHDNLFHSILGIMDVQTTIYEKELDIFNNCK